MAALSGLDAVWLGLDGPRTVGHGAWILMFAPEAGFGPGAAEMREQIAERLPRILPLRRVLVRDPAAPKGYSWAEAEADVDRHVFEHRLSGAADRVELGTLVARLNESALDRDRPLWEMHVIGGLEDGAVAALFKLHHAAGDGAVHSTAIERLFDAPRGDEGFLPAGHSPSPRGANGRRPEDILLPTGPKTPFNQPLSDERGVAFCSVSMGRIQAIKTAVGTTHTETLHLLWGGALRGWLALRGALPRHPLVARVPVSLRTADDSVDAGNRVGILLAEVPTHIGDFHARAEAARGSIRRARERPIAPGARGGHRVNLSLATLVGPQPPMNWRGVPMVAAYAFGLVNAIGLAITCVTCGDEVMIGVHVDRTHVPDPWTMVRAFEAAVDDAELALAERGAPR
jgi:diacylglycerol O-acyltransferase / wax synthase